MSILLTADIKGDTETGKLPRMAAYMFDRLTGGDDSVCLTAIASAELWVTSRLERAGIAVDFEVAEVREAAIMRTLYELYAFGENEFQARDKKKEALAILRTKYGSVVADDAAEQPAPAASTPGLAVGSAAAGRTDWDGF